MTTGRRVVRTLVAWCPDWPVAACGCAPGEAVAVVGSGRVVACSPAARAEGVRIGLQRREAQSRCPGLAVIPRDAGREARTFEPVVVAVESLVPGVEVVRPGVLTLATRGPSRYFGGDHALAERLAEVIVEAAGAMLECGVGVADGRFAAGLAARSALRTASGAGVAPPAAIPPAPAGIRPGSPLAVRIVEPGRSREFVAPFPVVSLGLPDVSDLLVRLGVGTLGDLAALPAPAVLARFGSAGAAAQRLARGLDEAPVSARTPPTDLAVSAELDPPAERVDAAAFVGKSLAVEMHSRLAALGLVCARVCIEAETEHGERLVRRWRHEAALDDASVAERLRWQLDAWSDAGGSTAGIALLRLTPEDLHPGVGRQLDLWGDEAGEEGAVARSLARVQGLLGPEAVLTAVLGGGRDPASRVRLVPWGELGESCVQRQDRLGRRAEPPWPGGLAGLAPAQVHQPPLAADVRDHLGCPVEVTGRGVASAAPAAVRIAGRAWQEVASWAGPWPVEERWWDSSGRRRALLQVCVSSGAAHLLAKESGRWWVEATY